jgi:DNA-binding response OmpR family regulator
MQQMNLLVAGLSFLIVEDDPEVALDICEGLRLAGAAWVDIKASARQARARLMQTRLPDVVIIDNDLAHHETGVSFALWLRDYDTARQTLCVSYSGSEPEVLREAWPDDNVYHLVVTKPIDLRNLVQHIALARNQISQAPR